MNPTDQAENAEPSLSPNRHLVEVPDRFAVARWSRDADVATIARCILGTLKYEPHTADTTVLRQALEGVICAERGELSQQPLRFFLRQPASNHLLRHLLLW
jgi:hypothetical protein